ncbi:uncharacterized protein LOC111635022 [Centruroides sculpturatus]|uniref:uncharacterized protein LOC111635022 n=1 Tax=Centruroides sculpturatus TaxID=218467 RepID=UPI000C6D1A02|nr:uncharacterized protein LOC111635022 [Centruroides sculpturatus]
MNQYGGTAQANNYWSNPEMNQYGETAQANNYWSNPEINQYRGTREAYNSWSNPEINEYGGTAEANNYWSSPKIIGNGPLPDTNEHSPFPETIGYNSQSIISEYWPSPEMRVYEQSSKHQYYAPPIQLLQHGQEPKLSTEVQQPFVLPRKGKQTELSKSKSSSVNSSKTVKPNHLPSESFQNLLHTTDQHLNAIFHITVHGATHKKEMPRLYLDNRCNGLQGRLTNKKYDKPIASLSERRMEKSYGGTAQANNYWSNPEMNQYGETAQANNYWSNPEINQYRGTREAYNSWSNPEINEYGGTAEANNYWSSPKIIGNGPLPDTNEHSPFPETIGYNSQSIISEYWPSPEMRVYEQSSKHQHYAPPIQLLQHGQEPKLSTEVQQPFVLPRKGKQTELSKSKSSSVNSSKTVKPNHLPSENFQNLLHTTDQHLNVSDMKEIDSNNDGSAVYNAVKNLTQDEEQKLSENKIADCINEEYFTESNETEESPAGNITNVPVSSAEINSNERKHIRLRPLLNAFIELETYSLVSEIIYEEEEPDSTDDLSESDYSIELDTMSSEDELSDDMNKNEIFDECDIDQNILIKDQYQAENNETYDLASVSATCPDIESYISDLTKSDKISSISEERPASNWKKHVDDISSLNNSSKIVKEKIINVQPERDLGLYQEIGENELDALQFDESEFEVNTKLSEFNDVVRDSIGSEEFKEGCYMHRFLQRYFSSTTTFNLHFKLKNSVIANEK